MTVRFAALGITLVLFVTACRERIATPLVVSSPSAAPEESVTRSASAATSTYPPEIRSVDVALTAEQAATIVQGVLNPSGQPEIKLVRLTSFGEILRLVELVGPMSPEQLGKNDSDPFYVIFATTYPPDLVGKFPMEVDTASPPTESDEEFRGERVPVVMLLNARNGRIELWGVPRLFDEARDSLAILESLHPLEAQVRLSPEPPVTDYSPTLTPETERVPVGVPIGRRALSHAVQTVLQSYPIIPGNRWIYDMDAEEHLLWSGNRITETVVSGTVLDEDTYVAMIQKDTSAQPQSTGGRFVTGSVLSLVSPSAPIHKTVYALIRKNEMFRSESLSEVNRWIRYFSTHQPVPTLASVYEFLTKQGDRPVPELRFPVLLGFLAPMPELGADWTIERQTNIRVPAGEYSGCFEAFHGGNASDWFWHCDSIGIVRREFVKGGSTDISVLTSLVSVTLASNAGVH